MQHNILFFIKVKPYGISFATAMNWLMVLAGVYFPYEMNESFKIEHFFLISLLVILIWCIICVEVCTRNKKIQLTADPMGNICHFRIITLRIYNI